MLFFPLPPRLEGRAKGTPKDGSDEEPERSAHESRSDLLELMHAAPVGTEGHPHPEADDGPQEGSHKGASPDDHPSLPHPKDAQEGDDEQRNDDYLETHVLSPLGDGAPSPMWNARLLGNDNPVPGCSLPRHGVAKLRTRAEASFP